MFSVDLILMDIDLGSDVDGTQVAQQILDYKDIPVVFLSSHTESEVVEKTEKITSYGYVVKNSGIVVLDASIKMALKLFYEKNEHKLKELALQESEKRFHELFERAPLGYQSLDSDGRFLAVNPAWLETLGYNYEEVIGKWFGDFLAPEYAHVFRERFPLFIARGHIHSEFYMLHKNGNKVYIVFDGRIGHNVDGSFKQTHCILKDETDRKQSESALYKSEQFFKSALDGLSSHIAIVDDAGEIVITNRAYRDFAESNGTLPVAVSEGVNYLAVCDAVQGDESDDADVFARGVRDVLSGKSQFFEMEYPCHSADEQRWFVGRVTPFISEGSRLVVIAHENITEREKNKKSLKNIQWMLSKKEENKKRYTPEYGDLTELNKNGLIFSSLGKDLLMHISSEYLDLLETSSAVYEKNGDYALGLFSSGWCQMMDTGSRKLCNTDNNKEALGCGKWLCHESCWHDASLKSIKSGQPVDVECSGGLRLYAVPVHANGEIIGAINFGYGNPPEDDIKLQKLSDQYHIPVEELRKKRDEYQARPQYIIDYAKKRIRFTATHIGNLVERKQMEMALKASNEEFEAINEELTMAMEEMEATNEELLSTNQSLQRAEKALGDSEEKYRSIFASMTEIVVLHELVYDDDGNPSNYRIIDCNSAFTRILGIKREDAVGRLATDVYGSDSAPYLDKYARVAMTGEPFSLVTSYQPMNKHFEIHVAGSAKNMFVTVTTDITKYKQAEKEIQKQLTEKETLLREVHHRVKNNIANVANLLSLQVNSTNNPEVKEALQDAESRVQSMSILYEKLLVSKDLREISMKNYIEDLIRSLNDVFVDKDNITIDTQILDFNINSKKAITIGIIINELLTNAFKYAFKNRDKGTVFVSIEKNESMVTIIIQDNGIGIDEKIMENISSGFGLTIVKMLVEQLEGTYSIVNENGPKSLVQVEI
jgi:PAS domain S-box-containing protein